MKYPDTSGGKSEGIVTVSAAVVKQVKEKKEKMNKSLWRSHFRLYLEAEQRKFIQEFHEQTGHKQWNSKKF